MADQVEKTVPVGYASDPRRGKWLTPALLIQGGILVLILGVHYWPVLKRLVRIWSDNSDWSHGFVIPLFSIYYLYLQRDRMPRSLSDRSGGSLVAGAALLTVGFAMYLGSTHVLWAYPQAVSLVISIMGVVLLVAGWPMARWSWFAIAFLMFAIPLPQRLYNQLTLPLREIAATVSAGVLSLVPEMEAEARGTVVEYIYRGEGGAPLDIEQACSGMRLLITMTALGVAMAFLHERPLWQRMIMILACVPIAIFCNFIRVTTTGFFVVFDREDLARGMWHTLLGLGMLVIAFSLYGGISYILNHLFEEAPSGRDARPAAALGG